MDSNSSGGAQSSSAANTSSSSSSCSVTVTPSSGSGGHQRTIKVEATGAVVESADEQQQQSRRQQNGGGIIQNGDPASALFQQHFNIQQTNGHPPSAAVIQSGFNPNAAPNAAFPASNEAMQAFAAAAAANNLGLLCTPPGASVPQFPSGAFPLVNYGQRPPPPMAQQLAAVQQQQQRHATVGTPLRKNGPSSLAPHHSSSTPSSSATPSSSSSSINRSQRCGVCRGCQCKPCGQCTYCQDSPQFGGPGVKKQSCIERRCLRVLENRLQRDAPTFKARIGCNACEDCRSPDCQICLVCLDKRFFSGRYMCGALCAKKRCNNATSLELPCALDRTSLKRHSTDQQILSSNGLQSHHHQQQQLLAKRQLIQQQQQSAACASPVAHCNNLNSNIARILSAAQHHDGGGKAEKYGRSSGGNSTTNSPMSESGGVVPSSAAATEGTTPPSSQQQQQLLFRPLWPPPHSAPQISAHSHQMLVPLGMPPYSAASFDQMASLAAAAAVGGFPAHAQPHQHNFHAQPSANYYQPTKFLAAGVAYPKYEYFEEGAAATVAAALNGRGDEQAAQQQHNNNNNSQGSGTTAEGDGNNSNPFVPPSYSAERKVVLQPL